MRVVCWWWWVPGCRPQSYCHICLISYLSFCVLAQSLPRCLLLLSPHITCQSIDSYFSYAVPQGSGHTILHAGLKESWSYTNKCKLSSQHSTENTLLNLWKDNKIIQIILNMGNTNVCKVLWHVRGARAGLGRTTTGAGTMLLCADPRLVSRMGAGATNTDILSRYLCISHHSPRPMKIPPKTKYHCRHSSLGALLCSACCVDTGKQRSRISAGHKSVHFNALLGYIPFHILIFWFWF